MAPLKSAEPAATAEGVEALGGLTAHLICVLDRLQSACNALLTEAAEHPDAAYARGITYAVTALRVSEEGV